jgi:hypothetical protein
MIALGRPSPLACHGAAVRYLLPFYRAVASTKQRIKGFPMENLEEIDVETRLKNIETVLFDDDTNLGEALNITYVTLQESLILVGDFAHDLCALAEELMTGIGRMVPDEYSAARAAMTKPPDLKIVEDEDTPA